MPHSSSSTDQNLETQIGLALTLLCLLLASARGGIWLKLGILALLTVMIYPVIWRPLIPIWKGLLRVLEQTLSRAVFFLVFVLVVMPIGYVRRAFGVDPLRLRAWKKGSDSVFTTRDHAFTATDLTYPY